MLNAIRIIIGVIMLLVSIGFTFAFVTLSIAYRSQANSGFSVLISAILLLVPPFIAAWLLLFPKNKKQAYAGLSVAVIYLGYIFIDQIL